MLLAKFEFDTWFNFFQKKKKNKEISKNRLHLKPDDVIVMSSSWCHQMCMNGKVKAHCLMQQIIKLEKKVTPNDS